MVKGHPRGFEILDDRVIVRVSTSDKQMLARISEEYGMTMSDIVRRGIKLQYNDLIMK